MRYKVTLNNKVYEVEVEESSAMLVDEYEALAPVAPAAPAVEAYDSDAVANEISQNLEALVGTAPETAPKAAPRHPVNDSTTSKFANLNLQFGRNYDPTHR